MPLLVLGALAACGDDRVLIRGSFAGDGDPCVEAPVGRVVVRGSGESADVRGCGFRLAVRDSGAFVLAFEDSTGEVGWMHLQEVPARSRMTLARIEIDERDLAFPGSVSLAGAEMIEINGVRMGDPRGLPRRVSVEGQVLGVAAPPGILLVRPTDERLPDLRVQLDTAGEVLTTASTPGSLGHLAFGDSVRVEGGAHNGVVLASRVVIPAPPEPPAPPERRPGFWEELERLLDVIGGRTSP